MNNQSKERLISDDGLHESPSDQHHLWDQLATESRARKTRPNSLADLRSALRNALKDPTHRAEIAGILAEKIGR